MKKFLSILLAAVMVVSLAACGESAAAEPAKAAPQAAETQAAAKEDTAEADAPAEAEAAEAQTEDLEPIRIGTIYPLTGDNAAIGTNDTNGLIYAFEEINANGGIMGHPVELITCDSQGDQKVAMSLAEQLITVDNVNMFYGCQASGISEVVSQIAEKYQCPMMSAISTADALTTHGYNYYFRFAPTNSIYLRSMIEYLVDIDKSPDYDCSIKNIGVISNNTLLGQETISWCKYWAERYGLNVVCEVSYTQGASDLTSEVLTLKAANIDALVCDDYISDGILLTKTLAEQNFKPQVMVGKGTAYVDPSFIPATPGISNGISTATEWNTDMAKGQDLIKGFTERFGYEPNGHVAEAYSAAYTLKEAIELVGAYDRESIRKGLDQVEIHDKFSCGIEIPLPYNTISFDDVQWQDNNHHNTASNAGVAVGQIQDGKLVTVWPFDAVEDHPIIIPAPFE